MTLLITGEVGIGKSTVCSRLIELLKNHQLECAGFLTVKNGNDLLVENIQNGETEVLATCVRENKNESFSRYKFYPTGFAFGNRILEENPHVNILLVDEAGSLEIRGEGFSSLFDVLESRDNLINCIVVRKKILHEMKKRLNSVSHIFEVKMDNRDDIQHAIFSLIQSNLKL